MPAVTVWLNKGLDNAWEVLRILRWSRRRGELRLLCTHPRRNYRGARYADDFEAEPENLGPAEYVAYCLDVAQRYQVRLFVPGRKVREIVAARERFARLGTHLLAAADGPTLDLLASKATVYAALAREDVRLPDYAIVNDLAGFDAAWARLRPRHEALCYKPAVSIYGLGFRIVADGTPLLERLHAGDPLMITLEEARRRLGRQGRFADLLVMQYLPGPERSVDCLGQHGELVRCVVRRKAEDGQMIEDNAAIAGLARRLTVHFGLTGLFNIQFRDDAGMPYLLEINPRMSGGLPYACQAGLALPYWAIRLALGTVAPTDVPQPRSGVWVPLPEGRPATSL
jgi:hypothetical protein